MANTYFYYRIAPIEGLNRVIAVSASCHDEGSVIRIRNIRLTDPPAEVLNLHHIQSCKYLAL